MNMKRRYILFLMAVMSPLVLMAQKGLHIDSLFEGKVIPARRMVETRVRGRSISKYGLTFFHSLRFEAGKKDRERVIRLLEHDMQGLPESDYQMSRRLWDDQIFLQLPSAGSNRRLLCYKYDGDYVLVIYLEGPKASLEVLKKMSN